MSAQLPKNGTAKRFPIRKRLARISQKIFFKISIMRKGKKVGLKLTEKKVKGIKTPANRLTMITVNLANHTSNHLVLDVANSKLINGLHTCNQTAQHSIRAIARTLTKEARREGLSNRKVARLARA